MPGEYPDGNENPYRASNLDPRVDGGSAGASAATSLPSHTRESTGPAPSTLTTTADPTARSAAYAASSNSKGLDTASQPAVQSQSTPVATAESGEQQTVIGRTLGAIGLGGAASAAAGYLGYGAKADTSDEPRDTSAVATQPGMVSQESGPPKHYRRESIPTTAYPGGPNSPRAVAPPVGGTADVNRSSGQDLSGSNERGVGGTSATTQGVAGTGFGLGSATSGVPKQEYSEASNTRENIGSGAAGETERSEARENKETGDKAAASSDHSDTKVGAPGTATADAIDAGAFPLKSTGKEAELLGNIDKDPAMVGGQSGTSKSGPSESDNSKTAAQDSSAQTGRNTTSDTAGQDSSSHTGRDLAAGGAAAAAAGAGAHSLQHHERSEDLRSSASADANRGQATGAREDTLSGGNQYTISHQSAPIDAISSREPTDRGESHAGRDTALGAGTAAAGAGALAHSSAHSSDNRASHSPYYDATTLGSGGRDSTATTGQTTSGSGYNTTGQTTSGTGYNTTGSTVHDTTTTDQPRDDHTARNVGLGTAAAGGAAYAAHEHSNDRDLEKQREADAKDAAKREKEHQKEIEKQEKHYQKEMEKAEKKHDKDEKEAAHAAEKREKARLADEEQLRKRHEREAAAGVGAAGAAGAVGAEEHREKEKKPSIFKRIFKRRKNKDTGEDEDYSTDDEEDKARHAGAGSSVPVHHSESKDRNVLGSSRDETAGATTATGTGIGTGTGLASETGDKPRDSVTGLPYDPSKDPEAASRLAEHEGSSAGLSGTGTGNATGIGSDHIPGSEPFGYIGDSKR